MKIVEKREREEGEQKEEEETEKKTYLNNLFKQQKNNDSSNNGKSYFVRSFSFPATQQTREALDNLDKIAQREGAKKSEIYMRVILEFIQRHPLPNPQSTIDRMITVQLPHKPVTTCCVPQCRGRARFLLTLSDGKGKNEKFQVCSGHKRWLHSEFRFLVGYREIPQ